MGRGECSSLGQMKKKKKIKTHEHSKKKKYFCNTEEGNSMYFFRLS